MNSTFAGIILAVYQLIGLTRGPAQGSLEKALSNNHPQASIESVLSTYKPSLAIAISNEPLSLAAASAYAVDADTFTPLFSLNSDKQLPIASLTKIGTALIALKNNSSDQIITIPNLPTYSSQDALAHLLPGEQFRFNQLLAAALIPSANDAADSLAITTAGNIEGFTSSMNQMLAEWEIENTHYSNASGLVDKDNYASSRSLAKLAKLGLSNALFAQLTSTPHTSITDLTGRTFELKTTNELLGSDPRISGIKTGFTAAAGQCFVGLATIKGHKVITVILGSPNRFGETKQLLDWIERNWSWQ